MKQRTARVGSLPVRRVQRDPAVPVELDQWPATVPAVNQLLTEGLDLPAVTVLVGENGTGKSTLVEAIAQAYGLSSEGGSVNARHSTRPSESELHSSPAMIRGVSGGRWTLPTPAPAS